MTNIPSLAPNLPSSGLLIASGAYGTAQTSNVAELPAGAAGIIVDFDATAKAATPSVTVKIQGQDPVTLAWYDIIESAALTDAGHKTIYVHPAITAVANVAAAVCVPEHVRVVSVHSDTDALTFSVAITATP